MRGAHERPGTLLSYVDLEACVGRNHPLRVMPDLYERAADLAELGGLPLHLATPGKRPERR